MKGAQFMNYLLSGTESYLIRKKLNEIIKETVHDETEMSVVTYDASAPDFLMSMMLEDASTIPFFTERKVIVVKNCAFLSASGSISDSDAKLLESALSIPNETTILVFMLEKDKLDARKKIVKTLRKLCREFKFDALESSEFKSVLKSKLRSCHIEIDKDAMDEFEARLAGSLLKMESELAKLSLLEKRISKEDIELLISRPLEDKAFDLVNAVISGKMKEVFRIYRDLQVAKTDPILLNTLIGRQFHLILQVKLLSKSGKAESTMAQILGAHPYSIKLAHQSSRMISAEILKEIINDCAELDQKFKSGTIDRHLGFEHFLIHTVGRMKPCKR